MAYIFKNILNFRVFNIPAYRCLSCYLCLLLNSNLDSLKIFARGITIPLRAYRLVEVKKSYPNFYIGYLLFIKKIISKSVYLKYNPFYTDFLDVNNNSIKTSLLNIFIIFKLSFYPLRLIHISHHDRNGVSN